MSGKIFHTGERNPVRGDKGLLWQAESRQLTHTGKMAAPSTPRQVTAPLAFKILLA